MFGSCKNISRKYSIFRKCYFSERKMFSCVWLHFKKNFGKYFLVFGKEKGRGKTQKNTDKTQKNTARDRDRRGASRSTVRSREAPFASITISRSIDRRGASQSTARSVLHDRRRACELSRSPLRVPSSGNHLK